jgi:hypothetical protein
MPKGRQNVLRSKCSLPTHRSGVLRAATSPHACLRSYMVSPRQISSNLLTTFLSLVFRTTSVPCLVIFVFSGGRIGGVCTRARCLRAHKVLRQQLRHGVCCAHTPPLPPARVARVVGPAVLSVSKFARKALATSKEGAQVHWLGVVGCVLGSGWVGGGGVAEGAGATQ